MRILLVDKEKLPKKLETGLVDQGVEFDAVTSGEDGLARLGTEAFDFVVSDLDLKDMDGFDFLRRAKDARPEVRLIATSASSHVSTAIEALRCGAYDYVGKPLSDGELLLALRKAEERERQAKQGTWTRSEVESGGMFSNLVAKSPEMHEIFNTIKKIAEYKTTCLLMGESGTGKELIARAIHYNSSRAKKPFITVNCGAIPENLLESELFGHMKGAFTGAHRTKKGLFEEATLGSLFLDEIGELPLLLQVKLLRALQEEEIRRVGDVNAIKVDVRIIAATVKDLGKEVERGTFREDLFYRLHVLPITVPPLRDKKEDIPLLVEHFISKYNKKLASAVESVEPRVMKILLDHDWPGNVRELENTIERAMVLTSGSQLTQENLPASLREGDRVGDSSVRIGTDELSIKKMGRVMEEELILKALQRSQGNRTKASKLLEISHRALLYKIKRYKLEERIIQIEQGKEK